MDTDTTCIIQDMRLYNRADPLFQAFSQGIWEFFSKKDKLIKTPHFASRPDRYYVKMKTVRIKY